MVLKNPKKLIKGAGGALSEGETTEETPCWKVSGLGRRVCSEAREAGKVVCKGDSGWR